MGPLLRDGPRTGLIYMRCWPDLVIVSVVFLHGGHARLQLQQLHCGWLNSSWWCKLTMAKLSIALVLCVKASAFRSINDLCRLSTSRPISKGYMYIVTDHVRRIGNAKHIKNCIERILRIVVLADFFFQSSPGSAHSTFKQ